MTRRTEQPGQPRANNNHVSGAHRHNVALRIGLVLFLLVSILVGPVPANARLVAGSESAASPQIASDALHPRVVHLGRPNALILADAPLAELEARARQTQRDGVAALLTNLQAVGEAGPSTF